MKTATWQLQDAKNRFSEVVERARTQGEQTITKHGKTVVVLMSVEDFNGLERKENKSNAGERLVKLLRRCPAPEIFDLIERSRVREKARDLEVS